MSARHLYVHLPFCASRCGYCDFVTVVGRSGQHEAYVDALLAELALEGDVLAPRLESVFLGGGTPTLTEPRSLERLLRALPRRNGGDRRGESRDRDARGRRAAARGRRDAGLARRAELPAAAARGARAARAARRRAAGVRDPARGRLRQPLARPDLRHPGPERRRPGRRPERGARARAGARLRLRARGQARDAVHARARRGARAPGRRDGVVLRTGCRPADRGRLPLVRDGQLLPRERAGTCARGTTSPTGAAATTSASGSAPSPRSRAGAGGRRRGSGATSPRCRRASGRSASSRSCRHRCASSERVLLGLRLDEPLSLAGLGDAVDAAAVERLERLGLVAREGEQR